MELDPSLRVAETRQSWAAERAAKREAAFRAYKALYEAGLVNAHLLPSVDDNLSSMPADYDDLDDYEPQPFPELMNPSKAIAQEWADGASTLFAATASLLDQDGKLTMSLLIYLPRAVPDVSLSWTLYWNEDTQYTLTITDRHAIHSGVMKAHHLLHNAREASRLLLRTVFGPVLENTDSSPVYLFTPNISSDALAGWAVENKEAQAALSYPMSNLRDSISDRSIGLIRDTRNGHRFIPRGLEEVVPSLARDYGYDEQDASSARPVMCLIGTHIPKKRDFLHRIPIQETESERFIAYTRQRNLPLVDTDVDKLPMQHSVAACFIPSITHVLELYLIAHEFNREIIQPVGIRRLDLVLTALSHKSAHEQVNYERLEFFGDAILGFIVALHVFVANPKYPEHLLARGKESLVSNRRLAKVAQEKGLPRYINSRGFTHLKWRPQYISEVLEQMEIDCAREMSKKAPSDVVEALIAVAFIEGCQGHNETVLSLSNDYSKSQSDGLEKAFSCIKFFLAKPQWLPSCFEMQSHLQSQHSTLSDSSSAIDSPQAQLTAAEALLNHRFARPSLLAEALTHPSYTPPFHQYMTAQRSYQRLEFLGDSILGFLVTRRLFNHQDPTTGERLSHADMHEYRKAVVNGDFLGFLCLEHHVLEEGRDIVRADSAANGPSETMSAPSKKPFATVQKQIKKHLYHYLKLDPYTSGVSANLAKTIAAYDRLRDKLLDALLPSNEPANSNDRSSSTPQRYPWTLLYQLRAPKLLGDIIESCIAAVWIDSGEAAVWRMLDAFGFSAILYKILAGNLLCTQPREMLQHQIQRDLGDAKVYFSYGANNLSAEGSVRGDFGNVGDGHQTYTLFVGGTPVARVWGSGGEEESKARLSEIALEAWEYVVDTLRSRGEDRKGDKKKKGDSEE